jgi:hypothetical protein
VLEGFREIDEDNDGAITFEEFSPFIAEVIDLHVSVSELNHRR